MALWRRVQGLYALARQWGGGGRLVVIPMILIALIPYSLAVAIYLFAAGPDLWQESINLSYIMTKALLGVGTPLSLWLVWWYSKPTRRVVWVYDWLGGGLLSLSVVWMGNILQEVVYDDRLGAMGRFLLPFGTAIWGGIGIGLMIAGTAYLSDELRSERQERRRLEALIDFTRRITSLDYQTILNETVIQVHRLLGADSCVLYLWDEKDQVLVPAADFHNRDSYDEVYIEKVMKFRCPLGFGLTGWVMLTGEPYISGDVANDPRAQSVPGHKEGEKSSLIVPIQVEGRRLGVVHLTRTGLFQFEPDDLDLVLSFANQAALVIEHGRIVKELSDLSITDPLTGLNNARYFHTILEQEVKRSQRYHNPLSLIMIDSDSLKQINDRLGHQRGDEYLKFIGAAMRKAIRGTDYAFRYAGDEFLLLLPNTTPDEAMVVSERFRRMMEQHVIHDGVVGTVSVGVATMPHHASDGKSLLTAADDAMYASKRAGKNRVTVAGKLSPSPVGAEAGPTGL